MRDSACAGPGSRDPAFFVRFAPKMGSACLRRRAGPGLAARCPAPHIRSDAVEQLIVCRPGRRLAGRPMRVPGRRDEDRMGSSKENSMSRWTESGIVVPQAFTARTERSMAISWISLDRGGRAQPLSRRGESTPSSPNMRRDLRRRARSCMAVHGRPSCAAWAAYCGETSEVTSGVRGRSPPCAIADRHGAARLTVLSARGSQAIVPVRESLRLARRTSRCSGWRAEAEAEDDADTGRIRGQLTPPVCALERSMCFDQATQRWRPGASLELWRRSA